MTALSPGQRRASSSYAVWIAVGVLCTVLMWLIPGDETIPYHVAWAGFALAFGARVWSRSQTWAALIGFTAVTGGILVVRVAQGVLAWQETAEIPLMTMLMALLVWNVRRRQEALATAVELADRQEARARDEKLLTRLMSHEMRTPLTIASGYVELLRQEETDPRRAADLDIVRDELVRVARTTERLLRVIRLQTDAPHQAVDIDAIVEAAVRRWSRVAPRQWVTQATAGVSLGSAERLLVCLDTLIENAVRYTDTDDTIRVVAARHDDVMRIGVADSGRGIPPERRAQLNREGEHQGFTDPFEGDDRTLTGLGLGLVRSVAVARGGRLVVDVAPEGGAWVGFEVPLVPLGGGRLSLSGTMGSFTPSRDTKGQASVPVVS